MGARDGLEKGEPDVPGPQTSRELDLAEGPADNAPALPPDEPSSRGEAYAELRQRVEGGWEPGSFEAPRAELRRFNPERAALPQTSLEAAADYSAQHRAERPWLTVGDAASPEACRILAAMDTGGAHGHIRHEGWVTEEASMRRVAYREDPAQLDPVKRDMGIDGLRRNDQPHQCTSTSTRITDPDAFATAFARGVEHPKVREALDMAFDPRRMPRDVTVPIADLLGPDGHRYCTGWQLEASRWEHENRADQAGLLAWRQENKGGNRTFLSHRCGQCPHSKAEKLPSSYGATTPKRGMRS